MGYYSAVLNTGFLFDNENRLRAMPHSRSRRMFENISAKLELNSNIFQYDKQGQKSY
jgi:hypothetical protein